MGRHNWQFNDLAVGDKVILNPAVPLIPRRSYTLSRGFRYVRGYDDLSRIKYNTVGRVYEVCSGHWTLTGKRIVYLRVIFELPDKTYHLPFKPTELLKVIDVPVH